jgi:hypothetical protein
VELGRWSAIQWTGLGVIAAIGLAVSFAVTVYVGLLHSPNCGEILPEETRQFVRGCLFLIAMVPVALALPFRPLGRLLVAALVASSFALFSLAASLANPDEFFGPVFCF